MISENKETGKNGASLLYRLITAALVLAWMLIIGSFSAQQGTESSGLSRKAASFLVSAEEAVLQKEYKDSMRKQRIEELQFPIRKGAHMAEYGLLAVLLGLHLGSYQWKEKNRLLLSWICAVAYASFDEIHQLFVPGRSGQFTDVCIDGLGALIGIGLFLIFSRLWKRLCKRRI